MIVLDRGITPITAGHDLRPTSGTPQVSFPEDQHPVGDLGSDAQHEPFGAPVAARSTDSQPLPRGRLGLVGLVRRHDLAVARLQRKPGSGRITRDDS